MKTIPLSQGVHAIVDDADYEWLSQWKWTAQRTECGYYAMRKQRDSSGKQISILMHRLINETPEELNTDHIDGNGLNNQRCNLRSATQLQNMMNRRPQRGGTSPLKGAWFDSTCRNKKKWRSAIRVNGKLVYLGRFDTAEQAHAAYAEAVPKYFGEFSRTTAG